MFNKNRFRAAIVENGKTLKEVAQHLNIDTATLYRKMNGTSDFYRLEIQELCDYLNLENPQSIFFDR